MLFLTIVYILLLIINRPFLANRFSFSFTPCYFFLLSLSQFIYEWSKFPPTWIIYVTIKLFYLSLLLSLSPRCFVFSLSLLLLSPNEQKRGKDNVRRASYRVGTFGTIIGAEIRLRREQWTLNRICGRPRLIRAIQPPPPLAVALGSQCLLMTVIKTRLF